MNFEELLKQFISSALNKSLINRQTQWRELPEDQQEALDKILDAIHDMKNNKDKIKLEYQSQALDAVIIKIATEFGMLNGGNQP